MAKSITQIQCPNCQNPIQAEVQQLVDVGEDPSAKARLLSGSLNRVRCPHCGYEGQLATPLVYHDPEKELLLTYVPAEVGLDRDEQEKIVGSQINRVVDRLPPEQRKAYLLQPKSVLTLQGLVEQVLQADGVTKEDLEQQREKMRLFEQLMRTSEQGLDSFVQEHDEQLDESFFQLASLAIQSIPNERSQMAAADRLELALQRSTIGKRIQAQQDELRKAAEEIRQLGEQVTRENLVDLLVEAKSDDRLVALVNLLRPAMDYAFFQMLSERLDAAEGEEKQRLESLRQRSLEITEKIDEAQQARMAQSAALLQSLIEAEDLDEALQSALPLIDDLFMGTLQANLAAAKERDDADMIQQLEEIDRRLRAMIRESMPASLVLAQEVLEAEEEAEAKELIEASKQHVDDQFLSTLMAAASRLEQSGHEEASARLRRLHKHALGLSMRNRMKRESPSA